MHEDAGGLLNDPVHQGGAQAAKQGVLAIASHGPDDVEAVADGGHQPGDFLRRILEVGVESHDDVAATLVETGHDGGVLTVVAVEEHAADLTRMRPGSFLDQGAGSVGTAVIHQQDLERQAGGGGGGEAAADQLRQAGLLVEDRDHD